MCRSKKIPLVGRVAGSRGLLTCALEPDQRVEADPTQCGERGGDRGLGDDLRGEIGQHAVHLPTSAAFTRMSGGSVAFGAGVVFNVGSVAGPKHVVFDMGGVASSTSRGVYILGAF